VAAPATAPRGDVLIACGYGENAEAWFETANALIAQGYAVWIMDAPGQGGSGRATRPHDLGHEVDSPVFTSALNAMTAVIGRPALLIAQSTSAPAALAALSRGMPVRATVLSAPVFDVDEAPIRAGSAATAAGWMTRGRLGWLRAVGQSPWERTDPLPRGRPGVIPRWQAANPDLRMGGASYGWIDSFARQIAGLTPQRLSVVRTRVVMLRAPGGLPRAAAICAAIKGCSLREIAGARRSLHLEQDAVYSQWSQVVNAELLAAFPRSW